MRLRISLQDLSGAATDAKADADIAGMVNNLEALVGALHSAGVRRVGLVLQPPPAFDQDGFGANYGCTLHRYRMKRAMLRWWAAQVQLAARLNNHKSGGGVAVVPAGLNLDTVHSMQRQVVPVNARSTQTVARTINGVHPSHEGQAQIADAFWCAPCPAVNSCPRLCDLC